MPGFLREGTLMSDNQGGCLPVLAKKGKLPGQPTAPYIGTFPSIPAIERGGVQHAEWAEPGPEAGRVNDKVVYLEQVGYPTRKEFS